MSTQPRMTFVNLPVRDLTASRAFFERLGFTFDERFSDETAACMIVSDLAFVMLVTEPKFASFATRPLPDTRATTGVMLCVSAESREDVDKLADAAGSGGGGSLGEPSDHGFMYSRSFADPDGHHWEVMWMDPVAAEQGPEAYVEQA